MSTLHGLTPDRLWQLPRVSDPAVAPTGGFAVVPVKTYEVSENRGTERLWLVTPGAAPRPLTSPDVSSSAPAVSPDGRSLAFLRTPRVRPGSPEPRPQVHVMPLDGGEARAVTELPLGAHEVRWLPDSRRLVVLAPLLRGALDPEGTRKLAEVRAKAGTTPHVTEDRVYRYWDRWLTDGEVPHLFLVDPAGGAPRDLIPDSERWFELMDPAGQFDISPDGSEIAFAANAAPPPFERLRWAIYTVPTAGGPVRCLTPDAPADCVRPRYTPDGQTIIYGAQREWDHYADRVRLMRYQRATETHTTLSEAWDRSPDAWELGADGALIILAEERGRGCLFRAAPGAAFAPVRLTASGSAHGPRPAGDGFIYYSSHALTRPPEVWRVAQAGGAPERLSGFCDQALAGVTLGEVEETDFRGAGGDAVQMFLVYPPGFDRTKKWPLVHLIHGGPHGVFGDQWHFRWNAQAFAAPGHVLAMVNFHGSSSFGQAFTDSILGDWGGKAAEDIGLATDLLCERGFIDPTRMAITGGSFGGYMACWLASQTSRYACAIAHAAVYNLWSKYATDVTQGLGRAMGGEPWDEAGREALARWNPAAFTGGFKTPMLVIHGEKDYRVPVTHGIEIYGILKARGVPARLVYYPDENHWILKPKNSLHWYGEVLGWLGRYLAQP